ncbi:MAG: PEP-CTERM sorting domain-containing protein [Phycisphaerales bacterium]
MSPTNPSVTVRVSAVFPETYFSLDLAKFDLISSDVQGVFSDAIIPAPIGPLPHGSYGCLITEGGSFSSGSVYGAWYKHINSLGCFAYPGTPLPIWEATWTATDFTPRMIDLHTDNTPEFLVYGDHNASAGLDMVAMGLFEHGFGSITVVPAPSSGALMLAGMMCIARRRR